MENINKINNIYDYYWNEVVNKTNVEVSLALDHIITLSDVFFDITQTSLENETIPVNQRMSTKVVALGMAIKALAKNAQNDFHKMEKEHIEYFNNKTTISVN